MNVHLSFTLNFFFILSVNYQGLHVALIHDSLIRSWKFESYQIARSRINQCTELHPLRFVKGGIFAIFNPHAGFKKYKHIQDLGSFLTPENFHSL